MIALPNKTADGGENVFFKLKRLVACVRTQMRYKDYTGNYNNNYYI